MNTTAAILLRLCCDTTAPMQVMRVEATAAKQLMQRDRNDVRLRQPRIHYCMRCQKCDATAAICFECESSVVCESSEGCQAALACNAAAGPGRLPVAAMKNVLWMGTDNCSANAALPTPLLRCIDASHSSRCDCCQVAAVTQQLRCKFRHASAATRQLRVK